MVTTFLAVPATLCSIYTGHTSSGTRPLSSMSLGTRSPSADSELIQSLRSRDPDAMMALYDRFGKLIYSIILRTVRDSALAEDLTQETFLRVWNRIGTFSEEKGNLEGWLVTVARNRTFDYLRAVRNTPEATSIASSELERAAWSAPPENPTNRIVDRKVVTEALNKLNPDQREVIELTHFEGMTQIEIAEQIRKPLGTVKGLVRSGLKVLRAAVAGVGLL